MLSSVVTDNQYRHLVTSFANTIIRGTTDGTILDPELLTCFAFVLRYAPCTLSAESHMLGSVLKSLHMRLEKSKQQSEPEVQYQVTSILSIVLDAMVDVTVSGIDRETLHEPLSQQLEGMTKHQNPRLAQAANYAYQALRGVPYNERPFETFQRQLEFDKNISANGRGCFEYGSNKSSRCHIKCNGIPIFLQNRGECSSGPL